MKKLADNFFLVFFCLERFQGYLIEVKLFALLFICLFLVHKDLCCVVVRKDTDFETRVRENCFFFLLFFSLFHSVAA